jgi:hypothetical protein
MNLSIKNTLKTLKNTQQQIADTSAKIETLRLASGEALIAAALLRQLRTQREDRLADCLAKSLPSDTDELDKQINEAIRNQSFLDDKAAATDKAIIMIEKNLTDLRSTEAIQLDAVFAAYFDRSHLAEREALQKTEKALSDFKLAAAELAACHEACSILHRGNYSDWKTSESLLYTRFENNQTLRELTKNQTEKLLKNIDDELTKELGLNLWTIRTKHPRQPVSNINTLPTTEIA